MINDMVIKDKLIIIKLLITYKVYMVFAKNMKELLKRQTQNEFLKLLQSKKSRRKADELTEEDIMELAAALHKSDAESGTLVMLNVIITVDEYAQWLEEVVQVLRKR